jgi:hypothetical protein
MKKFFPKLGNKKVFLAASLVLLTAFLGVVLSNDTAEGKRSVYDEIPFGAVSDPNLVYRMIHGSTDGTFSVERYNGDETWSFVDFGDDLTMSQAISLIREDAGDDDCLIIFWGDGDNDILGLNVSEPVDIYPDHQGTVSFWGRLISSANDFALIVREGAAVNSYADIETVGPAIGIDNEGSLKILDGTVSTIGAAVRNAGAGVLEMTGGTLWSVSAFALQNEGTASADIKGGALTAGGFAAISNQSEGVITISAQATVRATGTITLGTIVNYSAGEIKMLGGTLENTGTSPVIADFGKGTITVAGGTMLTNGTRAIELTNQSKGIFLDGSPYMIGNIAAFADQIAVLPDFTPVQTYVIEIKNGTLGAAAVSDGGVHLSKFYLTGTTKFQLKVSGDDLVLAEAEHRYRLIHGTGDTFTAQRDTTGNDTWESIAAAEDTVLG